MSVLTSGRGEMVDYSALCYGLGIPIVAMFAAYAFAYSWWWVSVIKNLLGNCNHAMPQAVVI